MQSHSYVTNRDSTLPIFYSVLGFLDDTYMNTERLYAQNILALIISNQISSDTPDSEFTLMEKSHDLSM